MAYLISGLTSFFLLLLSVKLKGFCKILFVIFAISVLSIIAGFRAPIIGTDTSSYIAVYEYVSSYDAITQCFYELPKFEVGWQLLMYLSSIIIEDRHFAFFVASFVGSVVTYIAINKFSTDPFVVLMGWFLYLVFFFCESLNGMRQYLALPFVMLGVVYLIHNCIAKYFVCLAIASLFHYTALVGVVFLVWYKCLLKKNVSNCRYVGYYILCAIFSICIILLLPKLINVGLISSRYELYLNAPDGIRLTCLIGFIVSLICMFGLSFIDRTRYTVRAVVFVLALGELIQTVGIFYWFLDRVALYFCYIGIFSVPVMVNELHIKSIGSLQRGIIISVILIFSLAYWVAVHCYAGFSEIYPYQFDILK